MVVGRSRPNLAVIFDLDGTLIDSAGKHPGARIHKRPFVDELLDWCAGQGIPIALWTKASRDWAADVLSRPDGLADPSGAVRDWAFVRADEGGTAGTRPYLKRLENKVFRVSSRRAVGFTRDATVIVEDTPSNCVRNFGNAIYVPRFDCVSGRKDWLRDGLGGAGNRDCGAEWSVDDLEDTHGSEAVRACLDRWERHRAGMLAREGDRLTSPLGHLARYLGELQRLVQRGGSVRSVEKRGWLVAMTSSATSK